MCFRTLDLYTSAVLESALNPTRPPKPEFRTAMDAMSKARPCHHIFNSEGLFALCR